MLFEHVRSAMGLWKRARKARADARALQMGKLVIGASDTVTSQFLLPHLDSFHKKYPNIHIQIISGRSHKVLGLLRSGKGGRGVRLVAERGRAELRALRTHSCFVAAADYPCVTLSAPIRCRSLRRCRSFCSSARPARACIWKNTSSRTAFPLFAGDRAGREEPARDLARIGFGVAGVTREFVTVSWKAARSAS